MFGVAEMVSDCWVLSSGANMGLKSRTGRGKTDDRSFAERTEEKRELRTASGRVWRLAAVFLLACTVFMAGLSFVRSHAAFVEPAPAGPGEKVVIVEAGDSLWKIAVSVKKQEADPRAAVQAIMKRNGLSRPEIRSGQRLIIPESILR
jgi:hypothetical protein